jgi:hypothetical protein
MKEQTVPVPFLTFFSKRRGQALFDRKKTKRRGQALFDRH